MENTPTLDSIIAAQTKGFKPEEVHDLDCAGAVVTSLKDVFDKFTNLEILSLSSVGLSSLSGFPVLPNLSELDLSDNKISGGLDELESCPKLVVLNLSGNPIKDLSAIKPLAGLTQLQSLDLSECEVSKTEGYQTKVFNLIQSLTSLDGFDRNNQPVEGECDDECSEGEDGSDSGEDEEDGEDEVGLSYLQKSDLGDDDSKDYEAPEGADDDDDDDDASDEEDIEEDEVKQAAVEETGELRRGRKRKQEATDEDSNQN